MSDLIQQQLEDQSKKNIFFPIIRKTRRMEIEKKKSSLKWEDFKVYPSSLKSLSQCPKEFIASLAKPTTIKDIDAIYKVTRGSYVHQELQDTLLLSGRLYDKPTNIVNKRIKDKLEKNWPEVPFYSDVTRHSGSADGVIKHKKGNAVGIEIKTTSIELDRWEEFKAPLPSHIFQVCDYMYHFKLLNYYDPPVEEFILCYLNLLYPPGKQDAEKEFTVKFEDHAERYLAYIEEETRQLNIYMESLDNSESTCQYEFCGNHGRKYKK